MKQLMSRLFGSAFALLLVASAMTHPVPATAADAEFDRGPHNGRLLVDGGFVLELAIFESGVPPEYRVWATQNGRSLRPQDYSLEIALTRLGGQVDRFNFEIMDDFLRSLQVVGEPHSFDVEVIARHGNSVHRWTYPSHEGRIQLSAAFAREAGLTTDVAGPGTIRQQLRLFGQVTADPERVAHAAARFPGIIRSVHASIGSRVNAGAVLASVEANESLRSYDIVAPLGGVVVARHANAGELASSSSALFTIADYSSLLLNLAVFPQQALQVRVGQQVRLQHLSEEIVAEISVLTPATDSPTLSAHAELDNSAGVWTPGTWIATDVTVAEIAVPLLVDNRALQGFRDWQVVFIRIGDTYEIRPLELGRTDGSYTEVLDGLNVGDTYVVGNSYLLKADLEKSGASHDH